MYFFTVLNIIYIICFIKITQIKKIREVTIVKLDLFIPRPNRA